MLNMLPGPISVCFSILAAGSCNFLFQISTSESWENAKQVEFYFDCTYNLEAEDLF